MKKLLLGLVLVFSIASVTTVQASIGETNRGDECTISREEATDDAALGAAMEAKPDCGCYVIRSSNGATTYAKADGEPVRYCINLQESIAGQDSVSGQDGVSLFSNYIQQIYRYGASIIGIICVLVIVVSGIQISLGGANSELVNQGKERIMQAMLSLLLLFGSALILRTINPGFFTTTPPTVDTRSLSEAIAANEAAADAAARAGGSEARRIDEMCDTQQDIYSECATANVNPESVCENELNALTRCREDQTAQREALAARSAQANPSGTSDISTTAGTCPLETVDGVRVHKDFKPSLNRLKSIAREQDVELIFTSSYRDSAIQATRSKHMIGFAVDLNVRKNGQTCSVRSGCLTRGNEPNYVIDFVRSANAAGMRWGGSFSDYDPVHFDINVGNWEAVRENIENDC